MTLSFSYTTKPQPVDDLMLDPSVKIVMSCREGGDLSKFKSVLKVLEWIVLLM